MTEPTDARDVPDYELNKPLETDAAEALEGLSMQNRRLATIQEYEETAISRTDPLAAVIGMGNAYFQRIFEHLGKAVLDVIDSRPHTVAEMREYAPEIRLLVKLRNAIETDLVVQPPDVERHAAALPRGAKSKVCGTEMATSERELLPKRWRGPTSY
jgi:hypothetical protein